ncbi:PopZ family protein [Martelella mangrovi]|uniref:Cell pole-organizing protein PopZ n=1 Tax=Martelella mangrovi TaxID=1397477 RepID=A0ABV2IBA6_9HYPH
MEEILASIRRIIDSGEDAGRSPGYRSSQPRDAGPNPGDSEDAPQSHDQMDESWYQREEQPVHEPVIVSRHHAADEPVAPEEPQSPEPTQFAPHEAEQQVYGEAEQHAAHDAVEETAAEQPFQAVYPGTMGEVARQVREASGQIHEAETEDSAVSNDEPLLSGESEVRISEALRELSAALEREGARGIEEIVAEELRPLLSQWLETHMPSIVENAVARELERMRTAKH